MTKTEINAFIRELGLPYTYDSFPNNIAPNPPYIVFNYPDINDLLADNTNYQRITILNIELYTATKDFDLENEIETALSQSGFVYTKETNFIRNEQLYITTYITSFTE